MTLDKLLELCVPQFLPKQKYPPHWIVVRITWDTSYKVKEECPAESKPSVNISYGHHFLPGIFQHWGSSCEQESHDSCLYGAHSQVGDTGVKENEAYDSLANSVSIYYL